MEPRNESPTWSFKMPLVASHTLHIFLVDEVTKGLQPQSLVRSYNLHQRRFLSEDLTGVKRKGLLCQPYFCVAMLQPYLTKVVDEDLAGVRPQGRVLDDASMAGRDGDHASGGYDNPGKWLQWRHMNAMASQITGDNLTVWSTTCSTE